MSVGELQKALTEVAAIRRAEEFQIMTEEGLTLKEFP